MWLLHYCALLDGWLDEVITLLQLPLSPALAAGPGQRNCVSAESSCAKVTSPQNKQDTAALSATCTLEKYAGCCNSEKAWQVLFGVMESHN